MKRSTSLFPTSLWGVSRLLPLLLWLFPIRSKHCKNAPKTLVGSIYGGMGLDVSPFELEGPPIKFLLGLPAICVWFT